MTFDTISMYASETWNSLIMTFVSSAFAYVIGIPLGILLIVWAKDGIRPHPRAQEVLGVAINLVRSVPFLILLIAIQSYTRLLVGTTVGVKAMVVPLTLASAPYVARIVESSLKEVDYGVIEAAKSMGASTWQIIWKVLLPEARPSLLVNGAIAVTTILGYSAMAGFVGAGGLGAIAINYGYYRYDTGPMWVAIVILVIIVQLIQEVGMRIVKRQTDGHVSRAFLPDASARGRQEEKVYINDQNYEMIKGDFQYEEDMCSSFSSEPGSRCAGRMQFRKCVRR